MGAGGAVEQAPGTTYQVPRLTALLRAQTRTPESNGLPDLAAAHALRHQILLAHRKRQNAAGNSSSGLITSIFGVPSVPTPAQRDCDRFIKAVQTSMGGQVPHTELQEASAAAWEALRDVPPQQEASAKRISLVNLHRPFRSAVEAVVGQMDDKCFQELLTAVFKLKEWAVKLQSQPVAASSSQATSAPQRMAKPFGADLEFHHARIVPPADAAQPDGQSKAAAMSEAVGADLGQARPSRSVDPSIAAMQELFSASPHKAELPAAPPTLTATLAEDDEEENLLAPKRPASAQVGATWLQNWCRQISGASAQDDTLATAVARVLLTNNGGDEMAAELFDLLGDGAFDAIQQLLAVRKALLAGLQQQIGAMLKAEGPADQTAMPTYGTAVSVTSGSQKLMEKLERKDKRKAAGRGAKAGAAASRGAASTSVGPELDWLLDNGLGPLLEAEAASKTGGARGGVMNIGGLDFKIASEAERGARAGALPKGTVRKVEKGYEEVIVPAVKTGVLGPGEVLVKIQDMPAWCQTAFAGYKTLNRIQSRIYPTAFTSNQNLLVCAPTGAGKTNIAMITVLREIGAHMNEKGAIDKEGFKVVYVAPMKALAAEVTGAFSKRLGPMGLQVRELTGDMQLTRREMADTNMIVTTPEKWDVITRKGGDVAVASLVKLLIIDEVHLLNDERGAVIETLIARTQRQVETSQSMIRIVGLSATLPNYKDVASFLGVNADTGLFYFDASYRPVPLEMQFVGVTDKNMIASRNRMEDLAYDKVVHSLRQGHQAMVFVHSRKDTGKTARALAVKAQNLGESGEFDCSDEENYGLTQRDIKRSRNKELQEVFMAGIGIHHAGMLRPDRSLMERAFAAGHLKVLCCTATLAWGVNLPAHTVIIKGTQIYDAQIGSFKQLGLLDVQQIFGRAGRPQFEDSGLGVIITQHANLSHYLSMLTHQTAIESQFQQGLVDNLNAEIVLGTVTNLAEASAWLSYTYLYVRMLHNPIAYGIPWQELASEPRLEGRRRSLITEAARQLEASKMARFDERTGNLYVTELGRVASHFYIRHASILVFNECLKRNMNEAQVLGMLAQSSEFSQVAVREEELPELDELVRHACPHDVKGGVENSQGKVSILLQAYISRARMDSFSLTADMMYVSQNAPRICRAAFEICLRRGWPAAAELTLTLCKAFERRLWPHSHALRQFERALSPEILLKLEERGFTLERLWDMSGSDIGAALRHPNAGGAVAACLEAFPSLGIEAKVQPVTRTVVRVVLTLTPQFQWREGTHGQSLRWHIWVEDSEGQHLYHSEMWSMTRKMARDAEHRIAFTIPIFEPLPSQYYIRAVSDDWLGAEAMHALSFQGLVLPERHPPHTELLDLDPLPVSALDSPQYEAMYSFTHFNPIQTQAFHALYHTDLNVLLGAPTGSGKTISAELSMLRVFRHTPHLKIVYIAPLKALVRERMKDWGKGLCATLNKRLVELTGDVTPDMRALLAADVIIATPEKWDGVSRGWQGRGYVQQVALLILDEIHLLGADRGPVLEVIVSRMRYIAAQMERPIRFVGLSTALANAADLADWLDIRPAGLFNFKPSVRPVPLECHIQGYPGKFYCPRMATMNKPAYAAINLHSPIKPVLVFVSSRRQTRLTALDLIAFAAAADKPRQFLRMAEHELTQSLARVRDASLRHTLQFGIGLHHAGLVEGDRDVVEALFVGGHIQVLVATSTLAWGVNTPAHLVIIKGTEYFDAPSGRYQDMPITDILQMMGRAGRPQFDKTGVAVIMVHDPKKSFYKKFLYEPFPVESSLEEQVSDHINAEIVAGTIGSIQDAVTYFTWTFYYRRLLVNPSYYDLPGTSPEELSVFLSALVASTLSSLQGAGCVIVEEEDQTVETTPMGKIASLYYLKHSTMAGFSRGLRAGMTPAEVLGLVVGAAEFDEVPVRHNEDRINDLLAKDVRWPVTKGWGMDSPHAKSHLLLQAHMGRLPAPISDYVTDLRGVLDNSTRVLQALVDCAAEAGLLSTTLAAIKLVQGITQGCFPEDSPLLMLPGVTASALTTLQSRELDSIPDLQHDLAQRPRETMQILSQALESGRDAQQVAQVIGRLPEVSMSWTTPSQPSAVAQPPKYAPPGFAGGAQAGSPDRDGSGGQLLTVKLERVHGSRGQQGRPPRAYAPMFVKPKDETWWLVVGNAATDELLALKRVSLSSSSTAKLRIGAGQGAVMGRAAQPEGGVMLHLVSGCYLGLDQQAWVKMP
ncbi:hypothetical protein WJX73_006814 [Symbiochloris irregularis]|uniref:Activating signal cointegrator 1 complex subunit 3 n=1 Tax=Symbiochloris irregularis TaxID=706552 RepID=A0AAW1NGC3_9CHLO